MFTHRVLRVLAEICAVGLVASVQGCRLGDNWGGGAFVSSYRVDVVDVACIGTFQHMEKVIAQVGEPVAVKIHNNTSQKMITVEIYNSRSGVTVFEDTVSLPGDYVFWIRFTPTTAGLHRVRCTAAGDRVSATTQFNVQ